MDAPLANIVVLDFTRILAGPFATMTLGDLGADVIKVESVGQGDDTRTWGPPFLEGESTYFLAVNRNKRSICLDLKKEEDRQKILEIVKKVDVLVENFRPKTMERLGLSYETISNINPAIIYCSISGFGQTGPDSDLPGYDVIIQGEAGITGLTGFPDGDPVKVGTSIADLTAGLYAVQGILAGLYYREKTGKGTYLDISMLDSTVSLLTYQAGIYFATHKNPRRLGNSHPSICPYSLYHCKDGSITIGVANQTLWERFCKVIERADLVSNPLFATPSSRVQNRAVLDDIITKILAEKPKDYWIQRLREFGIPCGQVRQVSEVCENPHLKERGMIVEVKHPKAGIVKSLANPVIRKPPRLPPPLLGEHTPEILESFLGHKKGVHNEA